MPLKIEGTCPNCDKTVGVSIDDTLAMMAGGAVDSMMEKDGNAIRCSNCQEYVDPDDMSAEE